nr:hypothetical protein [uncultured Roseateles sp.]
MGVTSWCAARGFLCQALLGSMLLTAQLACAQAGAASAPTAAASAASAPRPDGLLVSGLPSIIEYPNSVWPDWLWSQPPLCLSFWLRSLGPPTPALKLTSTGMLEARLLDPGTAQRKGCSTDLKLAATTLSLSQLTENERAVVLVLPASAFPAAAGGAKGKVLVLRDGWPVKEYGLTLRRDDYEPYAKVFLWLMGIAVPGVIGVFVTLLGFKLTKYVESRNNENEALERFRRDESDALKKFFGGIYKTAMEMPDRDDYLRTIEGELRHLRIKEGIPSKAHGRLLKALKQTNRKALANELALIFPDHKEAILKPVTQEQPQT